MKYILSIGGFVVLLSCTCMPDAPVGEIIAIGCAGVGLMVLGKAWTSLRNAVGQAVNKVKEKAATRTGIRTAAKR